MRLEFTSDIPNSEREELLSVWRRIVGPSEEEELVQLSTDPASFVTILGDALEWITPLRAAAAAALAVAGGAFGKRIGERAADAALDAGTRKLKELTGALGRFFSRGGKPRGVALGIPVADAGSAELRSGPLSESDLEHVVATFVLNVSEIEAVVAQELAAGRIRPDSDVVIKINDDNGVTLRWIDEDAGETVERVLPPPELP